MLDFFRIAKSTYFYTIKTLDRVDTDKVKSILTSTDMAIGE